MKSALFAAVLLTSLLALNCGRGSIDRETLERAAEPAGQEPKVLSNPLHERHLAGTTPLACNACHEAGARTFAAPKEDACLRCHPSEKVALHRDQVACTQCHSFAAGPSRGETDCQRCHATRQGERHAITAHDKVECRNCHVAHGEPRLAPTSCLVCHEDHQQGHGGPNLTTVERCTQCHPPHTKALEAVARCRDCHKGELTRGVFRGHDKCETCHNENRREAPERVQACTSCHSGRVTLGATRVSAHARCESCHAPHDPRGTAIQSCRRCHASVQTKHPGDPSVGTCVSCHAAHPKRPESLASSCSSCHRTASSDSALHAPGRTNCTQCHTPHGFESPACKSCHAEQQALTSKAVGHRACASCHLEAHAPLGSQPDCGSCHGAESQTAPSGHRQCVACHEPHGGRQLAKGRCESCHADKLAAVHGRIEGGCASCHRAHGPRGRAVPPTCKSCHAAESLPALHAVGQHRQCATCHTGHGMKSLNRQTCLACHSDRQDHEPLAKSCVGCHPFGASR